MSHKPVIRTGKSNGLCIKCLTPNHFVEQCTSVHHWNCTYTKLTHSSLNSKLMRPTAAPFIPQNASCLSVVRIEFEQNLVLAPTLLFILDQACYLWPAVCWFVPRMASLMKQELCFNKGATHHLLPLCPLTLHKLLIYHNSIKKLESLELLDSCSHHCSRLIFPGDPSGGNLRHKAGFTLPP